MKKRMDLASARKRANHAARKKLSAANAEPLDQRLVARLVGTREIIEELAALGHELEQSTPGMVVLDVGLEVLGEVGDALGQDSDLDLRRTGIAGLGRIILDDFRLAAGVIDIGSSLCLVGFDGLRPGRDVVQRGRHNCCARASARASGAIYQNPARGQRNFPSSGSAPLAELEDASRTQLALLDLGQRHQRALRRDRDPARHQGRVASAQQHRLAAGEPSGIGLAHRQRRQGRHSGRDRQQRRAGAPSAPATGACPAAGRASSPTATSSVNGPTAVRRSATT